MGGPLKSMGDSSKPLPLALLGVCFCPSMSDMGGIFLYKDDLFHLSIYIFCSCKGTQGNLLECNPLEGALKRWPLTVGKLHDRIIWLVQVFSPGHVVCLVFVEQEAVCKDVR